MLRPRLILPGVITATAFTVLAVLVCWVFRPLHLKGYGQSVTGFLIGLDHVLQVPGRIIASRLLHLHFRPEQRFDEWLAWLACGVPVYFLIGYFSALLWRCLTPPGAPSRPTPGSAPQTRPTRRRFLGTAVKLAAAGAGVGFGYALVAEPRWFVVTRRTLPVCGLPPELDGLRLAQLTDIHHGPWLSLDYVHQVVDTANALRPDLVLLTGDYVSDSPRYIEPVVGELARLRPKIGSVAVLGNHDWYEDAELTRQELTRIGVPLLDNTRLVLTPERLLSPDAVTGLALCGVGDLWTSHQDYRAALGELPRAMPRLLLSHNPDVAEEEAFRRSGLRVDYMISGHTHGGQIQVPFMGTPVVPSRYGQKYASGLVWGPACPVFVCRGIGLSVLPLRLGVSPEIAVLELKAS
jgi:uncharacterized protein